MDIKAVVADPLIAGALRSASVGAMSQVVRQFRLDGLTDGEKELISAGVGAALDVIGGKEPVSASSAFVMAATAYRAAVADWNAAKAAHPAKD